MNKTIDELVDDVLDGLVDKRQVGQASDFDVVWDWAWTELSEEAQNQVTKARKSVNEIRRIVCKEHKLEDL